MRRLMWSPTVRSFRNFVLNLISSFHKISVTTTSNLCSENEMISMSRAWGKEKIPIGVPDRIRTYVLTNTGRALYPLELRRTQGERGQLY